MYKHNANDALRCAVLGIALAINDEEVGKLAINDEEVGRPANFLVISGKLPMNDEEVGRLAINDDKEAQKAWALPRFMYVNWHVLLKVHWIGKHLPTPRALACMVCKIGCRTLHLQHLGPTASIVLSNLHSWPGCRNAFVFKPNSRPRLSVMAAFHTAQRYPYICCASNFYFMEKVRPKIMQEPTVDHCSFTVRSQFETPMCVSQSAWTMCRSTSAVRRVAASFLNADPNYYYY